MGKSDPSLSDKNYDKYLRRRKYTGTTFVIGVRTKTVTFYRRGRSIMTIKYSDFLRIGKKTKVKLIDVGSIEPRLIEQKKRTQIASH
jgi:hypothetical protein